MAKEIKTYVLLYCVERVTRWSSWLRHCWSKWKVAGFDSWWCTWIIHSHIPGFEWASSKNECKECSRSVKASAHGWQLERLNRSTVLKCGSLILLEPSRTVYACTGIALLLFYTALWLKSMLKYSSIFANYINIQRHTLHPQLHLWHHDIGTWYCSSRDLHGRRHWNHFRLSVGA